MSIDMKETVGKNINHANDILTKTFQAVSDSQIIGWVTKASLANSINGHAETLYFANIVCGFNLASLTSLFAKSLPRKPEKSLI